MELNHLMIFTYSADDLRPLMISIEPPSLRQNIFICAYIIPGCINWSSSKVVLVFCLFFRFFFVGLGPMI